MNPLFTPELAKIKIAEEIQYAERQRLARLAVSDRPRPIDMAAIGASVRRLLLGARRGARGATPARAGA
jgi:hypothetical protein